MTEGVRLSSAEIAKRLTDHAIMYSPGEKRTPLEVVQAYGLLTAAEMAIYAAVEAETEV